MRVTDPSLPTRLRTRLKGFFRRENGSITIESMLILPMVLWSVFASYTFYDGYRQSSRNIKAAYAVADIISREDNALTQTYVSTLHDLLERMVSTRAPISMRVSYVIFDEDSGESGTHEVGWSCVRGSVYPRLTTATAEFLEDALPAMPNNGKMIIVETTNTYVAPFNIGFGFENFDMRSFVFTHPRIHDQLYGPNDDPQCT